MGIFICRCMRIPYMVLLGPSQGPIIGVVNFLIACSRAAHFAFLIACFLRASLHTDGFFKIFMAAGFFKIFMAAGFFKIFMAAGFFIMHVMNDVMASSFSCCVCVKLSQRFLESHVLHKT